MKRQPGDWQKGTVQMVAEKERVTELDTLRRDILAEVETLNEEEVCAFLGFLMKLKIRSGTSDKADISGPLPARILPIH